MKDIGIKNKTIRVHGKGSCDRFVPVTDRFLKMVSNYSIKPNSLLFVTKDGHILSRQIISETVERCLAKFGYPGYRSHSLRRTCATHLLASGIDIEIVQKILGHSNITPTTKYINITRDRCFEVVKKFHPSFVAQEVNNATGEN